MKLLNKYQAIRLQFKTIAKHHQDDKLLLDELAEAEKMLLDLSSTPQKETEKYKMLFDNSGDYIFVLSHEGVILDVNQTACNKYQIPYDDFIHTSVVDIDVSENREEIMQKVDDLMRTGCTRFEALHRSRKGNIFNVDVVAQKITWNNQPAILDICRDVTEQKKLQRELNASEIKLKKIINQISDGIIIFEKDGRIIIWNSGAENITGIKQEDAIGKIIYELQHKILSGKDKDMDFITKKFNEVVNRTNPEVFNKLIENEIVVAGKGKRSLQALVFPINLETDNFLFGSVIRDVTQIKEHESQLKNLIATKDKIFSVIAHDLRTPFNSIIGFTDLLLENIDKYDSDRIRKIVQFINLSAKPTLDVLTNLLNWVNAQSGQMGFNPRSVHLNTLVKEVVEILYATANIKYVTLNNNLNDDFVVNADVNMLKSVIQNLVVNAIKFSHAGGKVDIYAHRLKNFVEVIVADEGVGIAKEKRQALFLVSSHETSKGTMGEKGSGLGLVLCKEFIERHGGEIRVESEPGEGSRFIFTLPLAGQEPEKPDDL